MITVLKAGEKNWLVMYCIRVNDWLNLSFCFCSFGSSLSLFRISSVFRQLSIKTSKEKNNFICSVNTPADHREEGDQWVDSLIKNVTDRKPAVSYSAALPPDGQTASLQVPKQLILYFFYYYLPELFTPLFLFLSTVFICNSGCTILNFFFADVSKFYYSFSW